MFSSICRSNLIFTRIKFIPFRSSSIKIVHKNEYENENKLRVSTPDQMLKKLYQLKSNSKSYEKSYIKNVCCEVENFSLGMTAEQAVNALIILCDLKVSLESDVCIALRNIIEVNIADLNLVTTIMLANLLDKEEKYSALGSVLSMIYTRDLEKQFDLLSNDNKVKALLYILTSTQPFPHRFDYVKFIIDKLLCNQNNWKFSIEQADNILYGISHSDYTIDENILLEFLSFIDKTLIENINEMDYKQMVKFLRFYSKLSYKSTGFAENVLLRITNENQNLTEEIFVFSVLNDCVSSFGVLNIPEA